MGIVDFVITIISLIIIYKLFEQEKVKGAFIFRLAVNVISSIFIQGNNINKILLFSKFANNGTLFLVLSLIAFVICLYITNLLEYHVAFKSYGHMVIAYIFVCGLMEFATSFIFTCIFYLLQITLLGKIY